MDSYEFDYSKLKGRIKEVLGTQEVYAEKIGLSRTSLSLRLSGKLEFTQQEIRKSCDVLEFEPSEIPAYFYNWSLEN